MSRTVLVTGGGGKVGGELVSALRGEGWRVRALVHRSPVPDADEETAGDLTAPETIARAVEGANAIVHAAAVTHARRARAYDLNVTGTRLLVQAGREAGIERFVLASTRAISSEGGAYSVSKLRAESEVVDGGVPFAIVRLPEMYGAGGIEGVDRIIDAARAGGPVLLAGRGGDRVCPVHVREGSRALARAVAAEAAANRIYTLAGDCMSLADFSTACLAAFESSSRVIFVPYWSLRALGAVARWAPLPIYPDQLARLRAAKPPASPEAKLDLRFQPRPVEQGLRELASRRPSPPPQRRARERSG